MPTKSGYPVYQSENSKKVRTRLRPNPADHGPLRGFEPCLQSGRICSNNRAGNF